VCVGGVANLTTSSHTVANLLISVKMFFKKVFDLLFIIRQLLWENFTEVLKKNYLVKMVPCVQYF
jgi:hypothetical protein